jgi:hypothetical protein
LRECAGAASTRHWIRRNTASISAAGIAAADQIVEREANELDRAGVNFTFRHFHGRDDERDADGVGFR